jgi:hypothetical protein
MCQHEGLCNTARLGTLGYHMSPAISNNIFLWWLLLRARKTYRATWVLGTWPMGPLNHRPGLVPWVIRSGPGCFVLSRVLIMTQGYVWREPWVIPQLLYESCPIRMCYTSFWPEFQGDSESAAINIKFCLWHPLWLAFVFQPHYKTKQDDLYIILTGFLRRFWIWSVVYISF